MHPLMDNIDHLSTDIINNQIRDLTKKYWSTQNTSVQEQIVLVLDTLKLELETRLQKQIKEVSEEKDLDNLINIS